MLPLQQGNDHDDTQWVRIFENMSLAILMKDTPFSVDQASSMNEERVLEIHPRNFHIDNHKYQTKMMLGTGNSSEIWQFLVSIEIYWAPHTPQDVSHHQDDMNHFQ